MKKIYNKCFKNININIVSWVFVALLVVNFMALIILGFFNHAVGDDYYYGYLPRQSFVQGDIIGTFAEALKGVKTEYFRWQGTYSAMFFMYLSPVVFGEWAYKLVTAGILSSMTACVYYFTYVFICILPERLGATEEECTKLPAYQRIVMCVYLLLSVETTLFPTESFFWYNGSMYYTWYFSVTIAFLGMILHYILDAKKVFVPILVFLAAFIAGGNYVSLLPCIIILLFTAILLAARKNKKCILVFTLFAIMCLGLFISAKAPGNLCREGALWEKSAIRAIVRSLIQGVRYTFAWGRYTFVSAVLMITPIIVNIANMIKDKVKFRLPLLTVMCLFGIFSSMACPTFYAENSTGPGRVVAICFYGFNGFAIIAYAYLIGHIVVKDKKKYIINNIKKVSRILVIMSILVLAVGGFRGALSNATSYRAVYELLDGEAMAYEEEYRQRMSVLNDPSVREVEFESYVNTPYMLYTGDFLPDAESDNNKACAKFFGKDSIKVNY